MIQQENGVFLLKNEAVCCMLQVTEQGLLSQLHLGGPVEIQDAQALMLQPGLGWGASVLLEAGETGSCADAMALAWSSAGRGDYRESPIALFRGAADFRYAGYEVFSGPVLMESGLPQARGECETLCITMEQPGARLKLYFSLFETALTRRTVLENTAQTPMDVQKLMSFCMDIPGDYEMTTFDGGWIAEMRKHTTPVTASRVVNESVTGFSSHRHNPGFLLSSPGATEEAGTVFGCNLIYSGNHYASAQQSLQGLTRVMQGISGDHFCKTLAPTEKLETPEAVICWSDRGFGGMSRQMHRFVNEHIVPAFWQYRERPVLYNSWEGCMFDFNQRKLLSLAKQARDLGCELFVLDDGWFAGRNHDKAGLGDYTVNKKKLPAGLKGLAERTKAMGLSFGLWFEPESVNVDSALYRAHPDWALTDEFSPLMGRNQLLLDLTRQEVRDYIVENVSRILDENRICYVKWDMNRHSVALGSRAHEYILGLYDVLGRIFVPRPEILLETCASGGNRFDLGMLCFGPQIWCSDNTDPVERLTIQENLSYLYPQSAFGAHVSASPHAQTLRSTPLETRGNVSFFGILGYELDLKHLLPVEEKEIKNQIAFYKKHRRAFQFGAFCRTRTGWQVSGGAVTLAGVFSRCRPAAPGYEYLQVKGLDKAKIFHFCTREQALRIGQFGSLIKHVAPVDLNPNGLVMRTVDKYRTLSDGIHQGKASGGALEAGIPMLPMFRGTGYREDQRTQLDFGSNIYIIEEENTHG